MKYPPTSHSLTSGEVITIRTAQPEDSENLIEAVKAYFRTTDFFLMTPAEFNPTLEMETAWIRDFKDNPDSLLLLATQNGKIIGNIDLTANPRKKLQHTALIGMGILGEWRNKGVGTVLMQEAISWATFKSKLEILWLQVFATNEAAIKLYRKMGFLEEGRQTNFFKNENGTYTDNIIMSRPLQKPD
jgi:RimJ/RimL family protein N-acetyltransferase